MLSFNPITGQLDFVNPAADISGKLNLTGGTMTGQLILQNASATGAVNVSPTWNNAGTDFAGIYSRVTNTASGTASRLLSLGTVAGGELFGVRKTGSIWLGGSNASIARRADVNMLLLHTLDSNEGAAVIGIGSAGFNYGVNISRLANLAWTNDSPAATRDVGFNRVSAANLKLNDGSTGYGTLDVLGLKVSGVDGATHSGLVTSITVVNGIVTAVT